MKKKLRSLLCLLFASLFVGSGFSAWYFDAVNKVDLSTSVGGTITVSPLVSVASNVQVKDGETVIYDTASNTGTVSVASLGITLDQGDTAADLTKLIYFGDTKTATSKTLTYVLTITADIGSSTSEAEKTEAVGIINAKTINANHTIVLTEEVDEYITNVGAAFAKTTDTTTDLTRTITYNVTLCFNYKTGKKPQSKAEYDAMVAALSDPQTIAIGCSFSES